MTEIKCPECNSTSWIRRGKEYSRHGIFQKYQCKECYRFFKDETPIAEKRELIAKEQEN